MRLDFRIQTINQLPSVVYQQLLFAFDKTDPSPSWTLPIRTENRNSTNTTVIIVIMYNNITITCTTVRFTPLLFFGHWLGGDCVAAAADAKAAAAADASTKQSRHTGWHEGSEFS